LNAKNSILKSWNLLGFVSPEDSENQKKILIAKRRCACPKTTLISFHVHPASASATMPKAKHVPFQGLLRGFLHQLNCLPGGAF
jgi:hypothetical protein